MKASLELYKAFYYAGKYLNFSQASLALGISQSAISQAVKSLEADLDCRLFNRSTKQVNFTPEGKELFLYVETAFLALWEGERNLRSIQELRQGHLCIAASDTICKYRLLPHFLEFMRQHPHIRLHIINRTSPQCMELVSTGQADIAVVNLPPQHQKLPPRIKLFPLGSFQDRFLAGSKFRNLAGEKLSPQLLFSQPFVLLEPNSVTRTHLQSLLAFHQIDFNPDLEAGSIELLVEFVKIGLGISFLNPEYVNKELAQQELFLLDVDFDLPPRQWGLAAPAHIPLSKPAQKWVELLTHPIIKEEASWIV